MTNLEWLHSLEPKELTEWFGSEHADIKTERTCKNAVTEGFGWECSECGLNRLSAPNYCPNCGFKVVGE